MLHFDKSVIPGEPCKPAPVKTGVEGRLAGRDPWFDRLTVLSKVEGLTTLSEVDPSTWLKVDAEQGRSIEG